MSKLKSIIICLIIIALIIIFHYLNWLQPAENLVVNFISPVQRQAYNLSQNIKSFYNSWLTKKDLLSQNNQLKEQLKQEQLDQAKLNSLETENVLLKTELKFVQENKLKFVSAQIITGVSDQVSRSVIINRGKKDGLDRGMAVVADKGVLIGKIYEVYDDSSKVLLLTDNKSKVAATTQNADRTAGLVEGQFGLSFSLTNIPQNQNIKPNDLVVTSGLEGLIPKNLLIAQVDNVSQIESEIFKTATLKPIISFNELSNVLVIMPQ
ncbi:rod shape-determining protein MreC [Candidatus Falkowbacteria bacterium]|nr:rod shape-determining protein MreC [Candidatus Falkowbacteria bacterium]